MTSFDIVFFWSVLVASVLTVQCCLTSKDYTTKSTSELLDMADIVVYGRDTGHLERIDENITESVNNVTDCLFRVYCVLKGNATEKDITIKHIAPLTTCSGTSDKLKVGMEMIVALRVTENGNYKYHEGNQMQSSVFEGSTKNFRIMHSVTRTRTWQPPKDAEENTCQSVVESVTMTTTEPSTATTAENAQESSTTVALGEKEATSTVIEDKSTPATTTLMDENTKEVSTTGSVVSTTDDTSQPKYGANLEYTASKACSADFIRLFPLMSAVVLAFVI